MRCSILEIQLVICKAKMIEIPKDAYLNVVIGKKHWLLTVFIEVNTKNLYADLIFWYSRHTTAFFP